MPQFGGRTHIPPQTDDDNDNNNNNNDNDKDKRHSWSTTTTTKEAAKLPPSPRPKRQRERRSEPISVTVFYTTKTRANVRTTLLAQQKHHYNQKQQQHPPRFGSYFLWIVVAVVWLIHSSSSSLSTSTSSFLLPGCESFSLLTIKSRRRATTPTTKPTIQNKSPHSLDYSARIRIRTTTTTMRKSSSSCSSTKNDDNHQERNNYNKHNHNDKEIDKDQQPPPERRNPPTPSAGGDDIDSIQYCQVVIIGAGVSGLQCAHRLLWSSSQQQQQQQQHSESSSKSTPTPTTLLAPEDILVLEARDRIGGRVLTRPYPLPATATSKTTTIPIDNRTNHSNTENDQNNQSEPTTVLWIDEGAAWVHGVDPLPWGRTKRRHPLAIGNNETDYYQQGDDNNDNDVYDPEEDLLHPSTLLMVEEEKPDHNNNPRTRRMPMRILKNPVLDYLLINNDDDNDPQQQPQRRRRDLNFVVPGNPWTRPYTVLHQTQNIALFLQPPPHQSSSSSSSHNDPQQPQMQQPTKPIIYDGKEQPQQRRRIRNNDDSDDDNDNHLIHTSIRRHYQILRQVEQQVQRMHDQGEMVQANTNVSLDSSLQYWNQQFLSLGGGNNDKNSNNTTTTTTATATTIAALTLFYQHLLTCWQGFSLQQIPIAHFGDIRNNHKPSLSSSSPSSPPSSPKDGISNPMTTSNNNNHINNNKNEDDDNDNDDDDPLWDDEEFEQDGDFLGPHCTVRGGMQRVVQALALPDIVKRVQLNQQVTRIQRIQHRNNNGKNNEKGEEGHKKGYNIQVTTQSGSIIYAKACVVTIPVGCLRENYKTLFAENGNDDENNSDNENDETTKTRTTTTTKIPLSLEKQEALSCLTMGRYKKVFLTFDSIFWPTQPAFLGLMLLQQQQQSSSPQKATNDGSPNHSDHHHHPLGANLLLDNLWAKDGHPCIEAILSGDQAVWATHKPDHVIRDTVLEFMQTAMNVQLEYRTGNTDHIHKKDDNDDDDDDHQSHPTTHSPPKNDSNSQYAVRARCLDCHITRWEEDPYCRGAYAGLSMGGSYRHCRALRTPEWDGALWFGGDATSLEFEGSVPAAIFSGRYTAQKVLNFLAVPSSSSSEQEETMKTTTSDNMSRRIQLQQVAPTEEVLSPVVLYDHLSWTQLPPKVKEAAKILGYTANLWDEDQETSVCQKSWKRLTIEEQEAALVLGYNPDRWDNDNSRSPPTTIQSPESSSSSSSSSPTPTPGYPMYDECSWSNLPTPIQQAARVLGHTQPTWDRDEETKTTNKSWKRLTTNEQEAASQLGYNQESWNAS